MAVSLTNFLDSGCIVASSLALTAWAAAFNFGSAWTAILGAIGANAFGAAVGALIGGFLTDKFGRTTIYKYNLLVYAAGVFIAMNDLQGKQIRCNNQTAQQSARRNNGQSV